MLKLNAETKQVVQVVEHTNTRVAGVEQHLQNMQHDMASAIERAKAKGMKEQESKLDAQFASIMQALHGGPSKRANAQVDDDEDHEMESPLKPPPQKK